MDEDEIFPEDENMIDRMHGRPVIHKEAPSLRTLCAFVAMRLPSLVLADLLILNSSLISDVLTIKFEPTLGSITCTIFTKTFLFFAIFGCVTMFFAKRSHLLLAYKSLFLFLQPAFLHVCVPHVRDFSLALVCFMYVTVASLSVVIYSDLYGRVIFDNDGVHERYLRFHRIHDVKLMSREWLDAELSHDPDLDVGAETDQQHTLVAARRDSLLLRRRRLILAYYMLILIICEIATTMMSLPALLIGSIGLLIYDLYTNSDQLKERIALAGYSVFQLCNLHGLQNVVSYNWFTRLRVPLFLRLYFILKCIFFTLNFAVHLDYYLRLNRFFMNRAPAKQVSLFHAFISYFVFVNNNNESGYEAQNEEERIITIMSDGQWNMQVLNPFANVFHSQQDEKLAFMGLPSDPVTDITVLTILSVFLKMMLLNVTCTWPSMAATTSIISLQFKMLGRFINSLTKKRNVAVARDTPAEPAVVVDDDDDDTIAEPLNVGDISAILFFLLSVQSGLTSLTGQNRVEKFLKNYSLLFIAILHYFHTSLDGLLGTLSSHVEADCRSERHIRVLSVCLGLILTCAIILVTLCVNFEVSTWLLAAAVFNIELIVKMSVSLSVYAIIMTDVHHVRNISVQLVAVRRSSNTTERAQREEQFLSNQYMDDYVYYIKATGHLFEFIVAIFLFFNGAYILLFESYGGLRAIMICVHAYFHIWVQALNGWWILKRRREAMTKIRRLPIFTRDTYRVMRLKRKSLKPGGSDEPEEDESEAMAERKYAQQQSELCTICFSDFTESQTRITNCMHFFHELCLRKWIYQQDFCPLCHQKI